ncbi:hypothetical protein K450DRAFT_264084 [Umbelopsis ramanniana AG]|uniref:Uncharacterized protein n=1 Tax=Umbelopsis ramanniana AG TaxID=1314678 RepID=A0AAD5E3M1_UMBRA|nr:uncharacterized protein K450DRAFT_264084 [Umbelopsis ramanniana AG]KAI8574930.1 hypothetical protein K450DRAFT_264084 [Umbelopsis ramanniana AG]
MVLLYGKEVFFIHWCTLGAFFILWCTSLWSTVHFILWRTLLHLFEVSGTTSQSVVLLCGKEVLFMLFGTFLRSLALLITLVNLFKAFAYFAVCGTSVYCLVHLWCLCYFFTVKK